MRAPAQPRQPLGGLVAAALLPPPPPPQLPGLGADWKPEGGPCECERAQCAWTVRFPVCWGVQGGVSRSPSVWVSSASGGSVCVLALTPGRLAWVLGSPFPLLPPSPALPAQTATTCAREKSNSSRSAPRGGGRGRATPQRGPPRPPASSWSPPPPPSDAASSGRVFGGQRPPQAEAPQRFL